MTNITKEFLVGKWAHEEWECELTMFNYLVIDWPDSNKAYGSWILRNNEVILTYTTHDKKKDRQFYIFSIEEIIDKNTIKTKDIEKNKEEIMKRKTNKI